MNFLGKSYGQFFFHVTEYLGKMRKAALIARERNRKELKANPGTADEIASESKDGTYKDNSREIFLN